MPRSETLPALTSLRFFAALWIVLFHGIINTGKFYGQLIGLGFVAVPFFFLLSGFILGRVYLTQGEEVDKKRFFASRFARIYPLYILTLFLDMPRFLHVAASVTHVSLLTRASAIAASVLMLQSWHTPWQGLNGPSWSLSVEAFFYLLFPFVGPVLWKVQKRWLVPFMALAVVIALVATALTTSAAHVTYDPLRPLPIFLMGILLSKYTALLLANKSKRELLERSCPALVLLCIVLLMAATRLHAYPAYLQNGLLAPVFAILILAFTVHSPMSRLLSAGWLVLLGEASYGLYLLHMPIKAMVRSPVETHFAMVFPIYLVGCILLSVLSFKYFERPARSWVLKKTGYIPKETLLSSSVAQ